MKKIIILLAFIVILILSGCNSQSQTVTCNKPYILVGNSCCLDKNDNKICDNDEKEASTTAPPSEYKPNKICKIPGFYCLDYSVDSDNVLRIFLENRIGFKTQELILSVSDCKSSEPVTIENGGTTVFTLDKCSGLISNPKQIRDLNVTYTNEITSVWQSLHGILNLSVRV